MENLNRKSALVHLVRQSKDRVAELRYTLADIHPVFRAVPFWEPGVAPYRLRNDILHTPEGVLNRLLGNTKVNATTDCWEWRGGENPNHHEVLNYHGENIGAHRLMYALANIADPGPLDVCHRCDNPCCINPEHLFPGTRSVNILDAVTKGRKKSRAGEESPRAKLTWKQVAEIRRLRQSGEKLKAIAIRFNTTDRNISMIARGSSWNSIPPCAPV